MATGTATLDFTSTPNNTASVTVTGLSGLSTGTFKEAFIQSDDSTVDNDSTNHRTLALYGRFTCEYLSSSSMIINCDLIAGYATGTFSVRYVTA